MILDNAPSRRTPPNSSGECKLSDSPVPLLRAFGAAPGGAEALGGVSLDGCWLTCGGPSFARQRCAGGCRQAVKQRRLIRLSPGVEVPISRAESLRWCRLVAVTTADRRLLIGRRPRAWASQASSSVGLRRARTRSTAQQPACWSFIGDARRQTRPVS